MSLGSKSRTGADQAARRRRKRRLGCWLGYWFVQLHLEKGAVRGLQQPLLLLPCLQQGLAPREYSKRVLQDFNTASQRAGDSKVGLWQPHRRSDSRCTYHTIRSPSLRVFCKTVAFRHPLLQVYLPYASLPRCSESSWTGRCRARVGPFISPGTALLFK